MKLGLFLLYGCRMPLNRYFVPLCLRRRRWPMHSCRDTRLENRRWLSSPVVWNTVNVLASNAFTSKGGVAIGKCVRFPFFQCKPVACSVRHDALQFLLHAGASLEAARLEQGTSLGTYCCSSIDEVLDLGSHTMVDRR